MILEFVVLFVLCFERVTEYAPRLRKRHDKLLRRSDRSGEAIKKRLKIRNLKDFVKWCLAERKVYRYARRTVLILNPFLLFLMLELLNGTFQKTYPNVWIFTWVFLGAIQLLIFGVIGNVWSIFS